MARTLSIGLYSQFFGTTMGGGEKYLGVTAESIREAWPHHHVAIVSTVAANPDRYETELNLNLSNIDIEATVRRVTGFHRLIATLLSNAPLYRSLILSASAVRRTRDYDLLLAMVYIHPVFSKARRTVILCQFPYVHRPVALQPAGFLKRVYRLPYHALRAIFLGDEIVGAQAIICQSEYVARYVRRYWQREPAVVHPPIDIPLEEPDYQAKGNIVLSVGRFFAGGHNKRHDVMLRTFKAMCDQGLAGWQLHLVGSVHREGHNAGYFESIEQMAAGYPIHIHGDAPHAELQALYRRAAIYWHAAGYGVDETAKPADLEHFGMTTAEAMANGAVPVVIGAGGQLEVVEDSVSGYHWSEPSALQARTLELIRHPQLRERMGRSARERSRQFSREVFKRKMIDQLSPIVKGLEARAGSERLASVGPC